MNETLVERQCVEERLERRPRRSHATHHVDMRSARTVGEVGRARIAAHRHRLVVDDQCGDRHLIGKRPQTVQQHLFQLHLDGSVERARQCGGQHTFTVAQRLLAQALCRQRRDPARTQRRCEHGLDTRVGDHGAAPHAECGHAVQHLVARLAGQGCVAVRPQARGRLRKCHEQRGFSVAQVLRALAEVRTRGHLDTFHRAAHRRVVEVQRQDLALGQVRFELQRPRDLSQLGSDGASRRLRFEDARHLHRERRAARDDASVTRPLPARAQQCCGVDARVPVEEAIFVAQQCLAVEGRHGFGQHRVAQSLVAAGPGAQRRAVVRQHHQRAAGRAMGCGRQRKGAVQRPQHERGGCRHRTRHAPAPRVHHLGFGSVTVMSGSALPTPRTSGRYMSSAKLAGTT